LITKISICYPNQNKAPKIHFSIRKDDIERMLGQIAGMATYLNAKMAVVSFIGEFAVKNAWKTHWGSDHG
jgi:hypothetical protein